MREWTVGRDSTRRRGAAARLEHPAGRVGDSRRSGRDLDEIWPRSGRDRAEAFDGRGCDAQVAFGKPYAQFYIDDLAGGCSKAWLDVAGGGGGAVALDLGGCRLARGADGGLALEGQVSGAPEGLTHAAAGACEHHREAQEALHGTTPTADTQARVSQKLRLRTIPLSDTHT